MSVDLKRFLDDGWSILEESNLISKLPQEEQRISKEVFTINFNFSDSYLIFEKFFPPIIWDKLSEILNDRTKIKSKPTKKIKTKKGEKKYEKQKANVSLCFFFINI